MEKVQKAGAKFNPEKAKWFNKEYLRKKSEEELTDLFMPILKEKGVDAPYDYVLKVVTLIKERATFVADFWDIASYLFVPPQEYNEKDAAKFWKPENYTLALQAAGFIKGFSGPWEKEALETALEEFIRSNEWPMGKVMNCLRLALVGASSGLGIADIVTLIGKEEFGRRIDNIVNTLGQ
jgi:glutamyl-tRNA synthetase